MTDSDGDNGTNASFWEPHRYSRTVKRAENANKLCSEMALMIQERSDIEKAYAANLRKFATRLLMFIRSGLEYGTCTNIFSGLAKEAEDTAEIHSTIASELISPVQSSIKNWQKENFHKGSISSSIKEVKNLDLEFENAQKTWYKHYKQVNRCKKDYFHACKIVRSLQVQVQNAKNEPCGTPEQQTQHAKELKKMEDKLKKGTLEEEKTRKAYEESLSTLSAATPRYVDDMTQVFTKAQSFERERINYFKQQALQMQEVLDISSKSNLSQVFVDLKETIGKVNADTDLKNWALNHGVDMPKNFPVFQEYSPELCALTKKSRFSVVDGRSGSVTLTSMKAINSSNRSALDTTSTFSTSPNQHTAFGTDNFDYGTGDTSTSNSTSPAVQSTNLDSPLDSAKIHDPTNSDIDLIDGNQEHLIIPARVENRMLNLDQPTSTRLQGSPSSVNSGVNGQDGKVAGAADKEDVDLTEPSVDGPISTMNGSATTASSVGQVVDNTPAYADLVDDGRPGVPIRALYDYVGVEADELSFNTGDLFEKLEDEDEQGWCKGRKDGRIGLYPANYVQVV